MEGTHKNTDPLPVDFQSEDAAAEFWDKHSLADYEESLDPVDFKADIRKRHFEIEIDEEIFVALRESARLRHTQAKKLASDILKQHLIPV